MRLFNLLRFESLVILEYSLEYFINAVQNKIVLTILFWTAFEFLKSFSFKRGRRRILNRRLLL